VRLLLPFVGDRDRPSPLVGAASDRDRCSPLVGAANDRDAIVVILRCPPATDEWRRPLSLSPLVPRYPIT